ncbi:MAG: hypothetical protein J0H72_19960 [Burkholderiales bacterium]|nr:hypothetical protein [Burkholderiales bacterium]
MLDGPHNSSCWRERISSLEGGLLLLYVVLIALIALWFGGCWLWDYISATTID